MFCDGNSSDLVSELGDRQMEWSMKRDITTQNVCVYWWSSLMSNMRTVVWREGMGWVNIGIDASSNMRNVKFMDQHFWYDQKLNLKTKKNILKFTCFDANSDCEIYVDSRQLNEIFKWNRNIENCGNNDDWYGSTPRYSFTHSLSLSPDLSAKSISKWYLIETYWHREWAPLLLLHRAPSYVRRIKPDRCACVCVCARAMCERWFFMV